MLSRLHASRAAEQYRDAQHAIPNNLMTRAALLLNSDFPGPPEFVYTRVDEFFCSNSLVNSSLYVFVYGQAGTHTSVDAFCQVHANSPGPTERVSICKNLLDNDLRWPNGHISESNCQSIRLRG